MRDIPQGDQLPTWRECSRCMGGGEDNPGVDCPRCKGTGRVQSKPSSPAPELPLDDATRKSFVLESIKLRQQTDPKFGSLDHFSECNFGSLSTYSGVVADYAQRTIAELQQKIDRMITANEWLMQDRAKVITELQHQLAQIKSAMRRERYLMWIHHGHIGIYGDDGEM